MGQSVIRQLSSIERAPTKTVGGPVHHASRSLKVTILVYYIRDRNASRAMTEVDPWNSMVARQSLQRSTSFSISIREKAPFPRPSSRHFQMATNPVTGRDMFTLIGGVKDNQFLSLLSGAVACSMWPSVEQKEVLVWFFSCESVAVWSFPDFAHPFLRNPFICDCGFALVSFGFYVIWNGEVLVFLRKGQFFIFIYTRFIPFNLILRGQNLYIKRTTPISL